MRPSSRPFGRAIAAVSLAALIAGASLQSANATDLDALRANAQKVGDEVSRLEHERASLETTAATLDREIDGTSQEIGLMELQLRDTEAAYDRALDRFVARAVETYKSGPSSELALFLSAENLNDAFAIADASSASAREDARSLEELTRARGLAENSQLSLESKKARLITKKDHAEAVALEMDATIDDREEALEELNKQVAELEEQARRAAARAARPSQALIELLDPAGASKGIPDGFASTGVGFEGLASWYGHSWDGNLTANGDIYDADLMTVASKTLPFGTWLYVEYNGKGVVVLVNDRGPFVEPRILDLSQGAARVIGMEHAGVGWVKVQILLKVKR